MTEELEISKGLQAVSGGEEFTCVEDKDKEKIKCDGELLNDEELTKIRIPRSQRKKERHLKILENKKERRKFKKQERKERLKQEQSQEQVEGEDRLTKRQMKEEIHRRLVQAMTNGQRVCVDLGMETIMTLKEKSKLAQQIGRLYGANRKCVTPAHIYLTGLNLDGELYAECLRKNEGFQNYLVDITEKRHTELFEKEDIVYLTPDGETAMTTIDPTKVYVLGGLVDEQINKNLTKVAALESGVTTVRLLIPEYMEKVEQASHSQVLAVNQVFEILLMFIHTQDWKKALEVGVPKRKGYVVKPGPP